MDCKANTSFFAQQIKTCPCMQGTLAGDTGWQESDRDDIRKGQKGLARADANFSHFFLLIFFAQSFKKKKKSIFPGPRESESLSPSVPTAPR